MLAVGAITSSRVYCERLLLGAPGVVIAPPLLKGGMGDETKHQ